MKKLYYLFVFLMVFNTCGLYAEDIFPVSDIIEIPPGPFESEVDIRFEPDPEDWDNDGLKNAEEERYGTDPHDPDSDNDGILDLTELTNGTNPNSKNTTGYLEVIDLETVNKDSLSSEDIIDADDLSTLPPGVDNDFNPIPWDDVNSLLEETDEEETDNTDNYDEIVPPDLINEEYLSFSKDDVNDSISKDNLNDLADEENNQQALLDSPSSGFDLTPIFMLLLLNDNDNDGMDDDWEVRHFGSTDACDPEGDPDQDNLSNLNEFNNNTDPNNPDTDGDGLTDGFEVLNGLNPTNADSDDDTMTDGWEVTYGLNPLVNDAYNDLDVDGFPNYFEYASQTDPTDPDSHSSGIIYNFDYDNNGNLSTMQRRE